MTSFAKQALLPYRAGYWTHTFPKQTASQILVDLNYIRWSKLKVIVYRIELYLCLVHNEWTNEAARSVECEC